MSAYSLISNHAFVDGNKRIGMYVMLTFFETNGIKLDPTVDDVARVGLAVAAGEMKYDDLLQWVIENKKHDRSDLTIGRAFVHLNAGAWVSLFANVLGPGSDIEKYIFAAFVVPKSRFEPVF